MSLKFDPFDLYSSSPLAKSTVAPEQSQKRLMLLRRSGPSINFTSEEKLEAWVYLTLQEKLIFFQSDAHAKKNM